MEKEDIKPIVLDDNLYYPGITQEAIVKAINLLRSGHRQVQIISWAKKTNEEYYSREILRMLTLVGYNKDDVKIIFEFPSDKNEDDKNQICIVLETNK